MARPVLPVLRTSRARWCRGCRLAAGMVAGKLLAPGDEARDSSNSQRSPAREPESPREAISSSCLCLRTFEEHPSEDLRHAATGSSKLSRDSSMLPMPTRARQKLATQPYPTISDVQFQRLRNRNNYLRRRPLVTIVRKRTASHTRNRSIAASQRLAERCASPPCDPLGRGYFMRMLESSPSRGFASARTLLNSCAVAS
jgi:hypothetical protein